MIPQLTDPIIRRKTDRVVVCGRVFYSVQWLAYEENLNVEKGPLGSLLRTQATWPVPFYQEGEGKPLYIEQHNIERMFEAAALIEARGIKKRPAFPDADNPASPEWANRFRLELLKMRLWTSDEMNLRGEQIRSGDKKRVSNPALPFPDEDEGRTLFDEVEASVEASVEAPAAFDVWNMLPCPLKRHAINTLVRHDKHYRPKGLKYAKQQRRVLIKQTLERDPSRTPERCCYYCARSSSRDDPIQIDHFVPVEETIDSIVKGEATLREGVERSFALDNLKLAHKTCNHGRHLVHTKAKKARC